MAGGGIVVSWPVIRLYRCRTQCSGGTLRYAVGEYDTAPSSVPLPSDGDAGAVTPVEREARWTLFVRFAIEAASEAEARVVVREGLAGLDGDLPLRGDPRNTEREAQAEWPPDVWQRQPDRDDVLLHPAMRAV